MLGFCKVGTICKLFICIIMHDDNLLELPSVTTQPVSITEEKSHNASFYVSARGYSPFTYQWYHNYSTMTNGIEAYLHITSLTVNDTGSYYCYICNPDNRCTSSNTVYLIVTGICI